jgi:hypothetical protein
VGDPVSRRPGRWRTARAVAGSGVAQPITLGNRLVAAGYANETVSVELRARLDWERDVPDTYSAVITFVSAKL